MLQAWALEGIPEVSPGDDLVDLIANAIARIKARRLRPPPWRYTDDTEMAMSIVECLIRDGGIEQGFFFSFRNFEFRLNVDAGISC